MAAPTTGRRRRSGEEVRRLLLEAARELFAEKGFADTTTREIIKKAGVSDQSLFSHFESKQGLFEAAMLEPFGDFVRSYIETWGELPVEANSPEEMLRHYVDGLYGLVAGSRQLLLALSPEHLGHDPGRTIVAEIERFTASFASAHDLDFDPVFATRSVLALITSLALFEEHLLPGYERSVIVERITSLLLTGLMPSA